LLNAKLDETSGNTSETSKELIKLLDALKFSNLIGQLKHKLHIELVFFMKLKELRLSYAQKLIELEKVTSNFDLNELDKQDEKINTENLAQFATEQNQIEKKEMCTHELFESLLPKSNDPNVNVENLNDEQFDDFSSFLLVQPATARFEPPEIIIQQNSSQEQAIDDELNVVSPASSCFVLHQSFLSNCECESNCTPFANPNCSSSVKNTDETKPETSIAQLQPNKPFELRSKSAVELSTQLYEEDILDVDLVTKQSGNTTTSTNEEVKVSKEKLPDFNNLFSNRILRTKSKYNRSITDLSSSSSSTNTTINSFNNRFFMFCICFKIRSHKNQLTFC